MSSPSTSYSETESSTSEHSSGDESVETGEPYKHPEPKVHEAPRNPWAPKRDVPIISVAPRQVAPMLPVGAATLES